MDTLRRAKDASIVSYRLRLAARRAWRAALNVCDRSGPAEPKSRYCNGAPGLRAGGAASLVLLECFKEPRGSTPAIARPEARSSCLRRDGSVADLCVQLDLSAAQTSVSSAWRAFRAAAAHGVRTAAPSDEAYT
jgi:hypothetical protein